jgi:hypothetical protein
MSQLKINFLVLSLIAVAFFNVLGVKYTTPDDIALVINLFANPLEGATQHAIATGRVWTIAADLYAYVILHTKHSSVIIYMINIAVTFSLYRLMIKLFDHRTAVIWLILFLAIVPIGWWYNILLAYPGFYMDLGLIALATLFFAGYLETQKVFYKVFSLVLYAISIFHYEMFSIISFALIILIYLKYSPINLKPIIRYLLPYLIINLLYVLIYVGWKIAYPLDYDGSNFVILNTPLLMEYFQKMMGSAFAITSIFTEQRITYDSNVTGVNFVLANLNFDNLVWFYKTNLAEFVIPILFLSISMVLVSDKGQLCKKNP